VSSDIGAAIRRLRKRAGMTIEGLATKAGIAYTSLQRYETGVNSPTYVQLARIAGALRVPVGEIAAEATPTVREDVVPYRDCDTDHPCDLHTAPLPLYESIPAGGWSPEAPERSGEYRVLHHLARDNKVVVRVRGESMRPRFLDGDLVLVDTARTKPRSGEAIIALFRGETTFKRYRVVHRQPVLMPDNPDFPPLEISDPDDLRVLGVVVRIIDRDTSKAIG
jgi:SOS-response transcriptional repressor LexA